MLDIMKQHGSFSWNELMTTDIEMPYTTAKINNEECAGIMKIPDENKGMPASWGGYVTVDDVEASVEQAVVLRLC